MRSLGSAILCLVILFSAFLSLRAEAGGPYFVDKNNSGQPLRWQNNTLKWCADTGDLSDKVNNATAIAWVTKALEDWTKFTLNNAKNEKISTTVIKTEYDSTCKPENINGDNREKYMSSSDQEPLIIFDEDGAIVDALNYAGASDGIVGMSTPGIADSSGLYLVSGGYSVFNGKLLTNGALSSDDAVAAKLFRASIRHELGHLLNLDHAQVNHDIASASDCKLGSCPNGNYIPTMYPELLSENQESLHRDDMVTISWIYPSDDFKKNFCTITGEIFDAKGNPLKGVNVIASDASTTGSASLVDARAMVSGVLYYDCSGDSKYYLYGIKPGVKYQVKYEQIDPGFKGPSNFEPLEDDTPSGFSSGTIETESGETTVSCSEGGQEIKMASVNIDIANHCHKTDPGQSTNPSSSSKCNFVEGNSIGSSTLFEVLFIFAASAFLSRVRIRRSIGRP